MRIGIWIVVLLGINGFPVLAQTDKSSTAEQKPKVTDKQEAIPAKPAEPSDTGILVLYRPFRFANIAGSPNVQVDDSIIGELRNNRFIELHLAPGEHTITPIRDDWWNIECGNINVVVQANTKQYVRMDSASAISDVLVVNGTVVSADSSDTCWIGLVEPDKAGIELKKVKRATEKQQRRH